LAYGSSKDASLMTCLFNYRFALTDDTKLSGR
jgi:hypothetical protein